MVEKKKRILVTGGAGFIGSHFIRLHLMETSDVILNIDVLTYASSLESLSSVATHPCYTFLQGNICDNQTVAKALQDFQPDAVIHFAAESHVDRSIDQPSPFIETNIVGSHNLLVCTLDYWKHLSSDAKRNFRYLHISTDEVYGSLGEKGAFSEASPYAPSSPYSASKAASDHLARAYYATYNLPVIVTNCSNNYGPYQFPEKLIPLMLFRALSEQPLPLYGDGKHVRDWLYVEDHCRALSVVLNQGIPGETYNIGGNCEKRNIEVVNTICQYLDKISPRKNKESYAKLITFVADRPGHDRRYAIDMTKIKKELGWEPKESFEVGLEKTVEWYIHHKDWVAQIIEKGYAGERLGTWNFPL